MSNETINNYSSGTKFFHWVIAFVVVLMLCVGFLLSSMPKQSQPMAFMLHKSTGISILFLMILRFIWVHATGKPPLPTEMPWWEKALARVVQYGLYVLLIAMPLSGWILSVAADRVPQFFGLWSMPFPGISPDKNLAHFMAEIHYYIAWALIIFISIHVLGALKHQFINKDEVLKRMLPGYRS